MPTLQAKLINCGMGRMPVLKMVQYFRITLDRSSIFPILRCPRYNHNHTSGLGLIVRIMQQLKLESLFSCLTKGGQSSKVFYFLPCFFLFGVGIVSCSGSQLGIGGINLSQLGVNVTKISDIKDNKQGVVYLQGQVATRAPFLEAGAYKLQDATGAIWVITQQTVPSVGDQVVIKGQLQFQSVPVGGQELGEVFVQQEQELERKAGQTKG